MQKRFQQTDFWCDFKCAHGWEKITVSNINILIRKFKKGPFNFSLAYVPMAPEFSSSPVPGFEQQADDNITYLKQLSSLSDSIKPLLPPDTLCIRFDLPLDFPSTEVRDDYLPLANEIAAFSKINLKKAPVDVQPPDSTFLDLSLSEDQLLSNMKNKWRYNLRYALKHGVTVRCTDASSHDFIKDLDSFYDLYRTTSARDGIGLHPKSYYQDLLERGREGSTKINLYIASHEGEDLAAIITLFNENEAVYLYGCSSNNKRNLMPAYAVQWTAITDAKKYGSKIYDFYGIPPTGNETHPMHGLYLFKTGFGGREVHRPGCFDVPLSNFYALYTFAEKIRAFYHKKFLKKIRGR